MPTASEYLDQARAAAGGISDYELAKRLGVGNQIICDIRKGRRPLAVYHVFRLAVMLDADPAAIIADLEAQKDQPAERADFWRSFVSATSRTTAAIGLVALASIFTAEPASASGGGKAGSGSKAVAIIGRLCRLFRSTLWSGFTHREVLR